MPCVYILTNPSIPGLLKIGYTSGTAKVRAAEISRGTGVAAPYGVLWSIECTSVETAYALEQFAHQNLSQHRYNRAREFFTCSSAVAIEVIQKHAHQTGVALVPDVSVIKKLREEDEAIRHAAALKADELRKARLEKERIEHERSELKKIEDAKAEADRNARLKATAWYRWLMALLLTSSLLTIIAVFYKKSWPYDEYLFYTTGAIFFLFVGVCLLAALIRIICWLMNVKPPLWTDIEIHSY